MKLTILIPAKNEEKTIAQTIKAIYHALQEAGIDHSILVINDHSEDKTVEILDDIALEAPSLTFRDNPGPSGFGNAIRFGLNQFDGDAVAIAMADGAENPKDIVACFNILANQDVDCVFGSRFIKDGQVHGYPYFSFFLNRVTNQLIRIFYYWPYNDFSNSFKLYKREVIRTIPTLKSANFSITIELSLKALTYTHKIAIPPIKWYNRQKGYSKFSLVKNLPDYLKVLLKIKW